MRFLELNLGPVATGRHVSLLEVLEDLGQFLLRHDLGMLPHFFETPFEMLEEILGIGDPRCGQHGCLVARCLLILLRTQRVKSEPGVVGQCLVDRDRLAGLCPELAVVVRRRSGRRNGDVVAVHGIDVKRPQESPLVGDVALVEDVDLRSRHDRQLLDILHRDRARPSIGGRSERGGGPRSPPPLVHPVPDPLPTGLLLLERGD